MNNKVKYWVELSDYDLETAEPLHIEARYPLHKERLLKSLNENRSQDILNKTRELQAWIKVKL